MKRLAAVLLLLRAVPCVAQQGAVAELTGRVTSAGQALPGVTVTLTSDALQGSRVTITGENGGYRFALLPPADYLLHFDLQGFTALEERVRVSLAETIRLDADLAPAPLQETVNVESDNARVPASASISTNLRISELERLPGGRDIRAAVLLSPSASALGGRNRLVIAGAASWDSLFLVDGVVVNEYLSGQPHNVVLEDAIQEIALFTGAISAEYGRFTGGVVSTLTKSGGNEFSGSVRDTVTNGAWTKQTPWPGQPRALNKTNHAGEGTIGGFLLKDRLWFFAAARTAQAASRQFTALTTNIPYRSDSHDRRREGKITNQITLHHSLILAYAETSLVETNVLAERGGAALDLATLIPKRWQPTRFVGLTYNGVLGPNWSAEVHDSQKRYALRGNGGRSNDRILGTLIQTRGGGNLNAPLGCGICGDDERDSNSWIAKNSYYRNTRWGNHTATAGAEGFQEKRSNLGTRSSSEFNIQSGIPRFIGSVVYPRFDSTTQIDWTPPFPSSDAHLNSWSGYVNDRWDLNRLSLNLGVRYDQNNARGAAGERIADDGAFSPRLSATFDLRNDGRHRLFAGYARYAAKILEGGASPQEIGTFSQVGWFYGGPEINGATTPNDQLLSAHEALSRLFAWFDSVGGIQDPNPSFITDPGSSSIFPRSLKSPAVDERSIGYAMQYHSGYVRADFVSRDWRDFYAARVDTTTGQQIDAAGHKIDVAWIVNDNSETVRAYRGVQLQGSWRRGKASLGGGYTWSKLQGNDEAEEGTTGQSPRNLPLGLWYPEFLGYAQRRPIGYLKQDQRHRARVWFGYEVPIPGGSLSGSLLQWFDSGHPYSAVADIDPAGVTVPYEGSPAIPSYYALNQVKIGPYFFSKRGAFRTNNVFSTDVAANYEMPYGGVRLFVKGDVLNLLNNAAVISPGTQVLTRFRSGATSGLIAFNPFTEVPVEGVHYRLSPNFGKPTGPNDYQTPRTFQLAFGARF